MTKIIFLKLFLLMLVSTIQGFIFYKMIQDKVKGLKTFKLPL